MATEHVLSTGHVVGATYREHHGETYRVLGPAIDPPSWYGGTGVRVEVVRACSPHWPIGSVRQHCTPLDQWTDRLS